MFFSWNFIPTTTDLLHHFNLYTIVSTPLHLKVFSSKFATVQINFKHITQQKMFTNLRWAYSGALVTQSDLTLNCTRVQPVYNEDVKMSLMRFDPRLILLKRYMSIMICFTYYKSVSKNTFTSQYLLKKIVS